MTYEVSIKLLVVGFSGKFRKVLKCIWNTETQTMALVIMAILESSIGGFAHLLFG